MDDFLPEMMPLGGDWITAIIAVYAANVYVALHFVFMDIKKHRLIKVMICLLVHVGLAVPSMIYFHRFFSGYNVDGWMLPLSYFTGFYFCLFFYTGGAFFIWDLIRLALRIIRKKKYKLYSVRVTAIILAAACILSLCAFIAPTKCVTTRYSLELDKRECRVDSLKIVFVADTHIGGSDREKKIDEIVRMTMAEEPDMIILGGDIFDEGSPQYLKDYTIKKFSELTAYSGVYFVMGNHDGYRGNRQEVLQDMNNAGITCLIDEVTLTGSGFYLIGRDDRLHGRVDLDRLTAMLNEDLPVILTSHRPSGRDRSGRVQLQIAGHTHNGQIIPANILLPWINSYGLRTRGTEKSIVSSGAGEYALPVRLGSPSEIVAIDITFE